MKEVEKQTGIIPEELASYYEKDCPDIFFDYMESFLSLNRRRKFGINGPEPISFMEIQAWAFCFNTTLCPLQVEIICTLDSIWLQAWSKNNPKQK